MTRLTKEQEIALLRSELRDARRKISHQQGALTVLRKNLAKYRVEVRLLRRVLLQARNKFDIIIKTPILTEDEQRAATTSPGGNP